MAHFAQIDTSGRWPTNTVVNVIVISNEDIRDPVTNQDDEETGVALCRGHFGEDTEWKQTSISGRFRGRYAGIGFTYDEARDVFLDPQPHPSWTLNETTTEWEPPGGYPADFGEVPGPWYQWDEDEQEWILLGHD